eukprot:3261593-Amphidinium_carterae.1
MSAEQIVACLLRECQWWYVQTLQGCHSSTYLCGKAHGGNRAATSATRTHKSPLQKRRTDCIQSIDSLKIGTSVGPCRDDLLSGS